VLLDAGGPVAGLAGVDVDLREALAELAAHLTGLGPPAAYLGFRREKASVQGRRYQPAEALQQRGAVLDPTTVGLTSLPSRPPRPPSPGTWPAWRASGCPLGCAGRRHGHVKRLPVLFGYVCPR
jgi:hypothetical protein